MQRVDKLRREYKNLSIQEKNQFLFWLGLSSQNAPERFSDRKIYECLRASLKKLSAAGDLHFEALKDGPSGKHLVSAVEKLNSAAENVESEHRERFLLKYCATAVGRLVAIDSPLTLPNLLKVICRHHAQITEDLQRELSY
ncbi:hypothetical protein F862_gp059 [Vibrio phage vB_VpaS_MAR10]|uniref:Uncharacterized protein n=1 Tax=Vibrio phage vB_VpaS_MAR10 TaxID=1229755 RepID=K7R6F8_9CAUD|nr:hypothetical protein F862_gp059 [Vibrio phage vB_VpaS_MAR10]AFV81291.1 hypothetical protein MAR10_058 [Vibrio phage vB_VpaS_MAR10]AXH68416.1 hypothetical protein [Vibrio phage R01]